MSDLANLTIRVDSSGVVTASKDLDKLTGASKQAENETKKATESINAHYVKMAAAIGTAMLAVKAAWKFAEIGAAYEEQRGVLDNLAAKYNTTADKIVESMRRASDEMVAKSELMRIALGGIAKGLKPEQLIELANAAKILADTSGTTTTNALNKLTEALEANRIRGVIKLAGANVDLGDTFGKLESKMTAAQKTQALYLLLIQYTNGLQAQQKKHVSGVADEMEKLTAEYADATLEIGKMAMNLVVWTNAARRAIMEVVTFNPNRYAKVKDALADTGEQSQAKMTDKIKKDIQDLINEINKGQKNIKLGGTGGGTSKTKDDTEKLLDAKYKRERELAMANYEAEEQMRKDADAGAKESIDRIMQLELERLDSALFLYSEMSGYENEYRDLVFAAIDAEAKKRNELYKDDVAWAKWAQVQKEKFNEKEMDSVGEKFDYDNRYIKQTISNTGQMLDAAMSMYDEESDEYKRLLEFKKGVQIAELAMNAAKNAQIIAQNLGLIASNTATSISNAGAAVTGAAIGVGPTGFVTAAAMIALLAGVFAMYGIAAGGGSSASVPAPKTYNYGGQGGVLGAEVGTASESLTNAMENVEESLDNIFNVEDVKLTKIYNELRYLNANITGLVSSIFRTGQADEWNNVPFTPVGPNQDMLNFMNSDVGFALTSPLNIFGPAGKFGSDILNKFLDKIFGGTGLVPGKQELLWSTGGIKTGAPTIGQMAGGGTQGAKSYQEWMTETTTEFWREDSQDYNYIEKALSEETARLFDKIYQNISETLISIGTALGYSEEQIKAYKFTSEKLNLAGKSSEEINKTLQEYFSKISDQAVDALFGNILRKYQEAGEGLYETAARIIVDKMTVLNMLEMTTAKYGDNLEERLTRWTGSARKASDGIIALSEELIDLAGGLENLTDYATSYYEAFYSDAEKMQDTKEMMQKVFADMGIAMPETRSAYRDIVDGLDLATEAGKENYVTLLRLSEASDKYYSMLDEIVDKLKSAREDMRMEGLKYDQERNMAAKFTFNALLDQARVGNFANLGAMDKSLDEIVSGAESTRLYKTKQEYEANFYKTYNSIAEMEKLLGSEGTVEEQMLAELKKIAENTNSATQETSSIKTYAEGGSFAGGYRVVGENGPELEYTGPSQIVSNDKSKFLLNYKELLVEVNALRTDLNAANYQLVKNTNKNLKIAERWDAMFERWDTDGIPEERA